VASLSQGRTAAAQCGLFTHKSVPVIFEPPCTTGQELDTIKTHEDVEVQIHSFLSRALDVGKRLLSR